MNEINDLVEKIKNRWKGDTISYTEMDMLRIIELLIKQIEELFEHVRTKDYYENLEDDLVRQIANNQKIMIEQLLKEKDKLHNKVEEYKIALLDKHVDEFEQLPTINYFTHENLKSQYNFVKAQMEKLTKENVSLHEALKWHPANEVPPYYKNVIVKYWIGTEPKYDYKILHFSKIIGWTCSEKIEKWCYIPEDKDK